MSGKISSAPPFSTSAKAKTDSVIDLADVREIVIGQQTDSFKNYRLPMLEHLSFSILLGKEEPEQDKSLLRQAGELFTGSTTRCLDVTCKDEFEFDHWVTGVKALYYHHTNRKMSKMQLLEHSKRFRRALEKNNVSIKLTKLPEVKEKGHVTLDDCIEIQTHTLRCHILP